jgi:hypothetical protein
MTESKTTLIFVALLAILFWNGAVCADDEPALPMGLGNDEPALPFGLGEETESEPVREQEDSGEAPFDLTGFVEVRGGIRTQRDRNERDASIGETRVQLETERELGPAVFSLTTDLLYDPVYDHHSIYLKRGLGWLDLREANVSIPVTEFMDAKVGRQILTWGTGDMLFVNDLFPKDWNSYFIGRDVEYLKAPSDAGKLSLYSGMVNVDLVYVPRFDADRYIDGTRLSYWNGAMGRRAGQNAVVNVDKRDEWLEDDEISLRLFRNVAGYELAAYGYHGFWKSPAGMNTASGEATFPELTVYGASGRGSVGRGIGNIEVGYYDSEDDHRGNDATVRNGEARVLAGYEQEVARDFTVGAQYYIEHMMGHDSYRHALPLGSKKTDEDRHVLTLRLTKLMMKQNLTMSLFTYYSPSDKDAYFRPNAHYKVTDNWAAEIGGNIFVGEDDHTFFGQFEKNNNIYTGLRYSF